MSVNSSLILYDALRTLGFASITSAYALVGAPVGVPIRIIYFNNTTNQDILVSFDGVEDHTIVPASSAIVFDYCSNRSDQAGYAEQQINTPILARAPNGNPTSGSFYATIIYVSTKGQG